MESEIQIHSGRNRSGNRSGKCLSVLQGRSGSALRTYPWLAIASLFLFTHCAFTEYGNRINAEQNALAKLENKRHKLETRYIIVLNNLETHPTEADLINEKDKVYRRLRALEEEIDEKRKGLDQSFAEWDQKILEERIQQQMIEKEVKDAEGRPPPPEE